MPNFFATGQQSDRYPERRASKRLCAAFAALTLLFTNVAPVWAQRNPQQLVDKQRGELVKILRSGRPGLWSLQQLLLQEAGLRPEDKALLSDIRLDDAQRFAFHTAVAQLEAHVRLFDALKPSLPTNENVAGVFQFAQAATAVAQVAASQVLRDALETVQDNQLRVLLKQLAKRKGEVAVEEWVSKLKSGQLQAREEVRKELERALETHRRRFILEASAEADRLSAAEKAAILSGTEAKGKVASIGSRIQDDLANRTRLFAISDRLLDELSNGVDAKVAATSAQVNASLKTMAQLEIGLRSQAAQTAALLKPLQETQALSAIAANGLSDFVQKQNLSVIDAVRVPLLVSQLTADPGASMEQAVARALGQLPRSTIDSLRTVAVAAKKIEVDFGGWEQTGRTLTGVANLIAAVDPGLSESAARATSLINTASNFIAVGQSIIQTVSQVSSGLGAIAQVGSIAGTFFATGGVGTALSLLSGIGGFGGLFGGGGRDDGAILAQLDVINQKLDQVLLNQRKTMEAIVKVSEQLREATNIIVQDIQGVSLQVTRLETAQFQAAVMSARSPCQALYDQAIRQRQYSPETGTFAPGERMQFWVEAFEIGQAAPARTMGRCREFLQDVATSRALPAPYLLDEQRAFDQKKIGPPSGLPPVIPP